MANLELKLDRDVADEHLLSLIFYQTQVYNQGRPFGPAWLLQDTGLKVNRETAWRPFSRLERKGYIKFSGLRRPRKGKSMASCEITDLGIIHADLSKLEDVFAQENEKGRMLIRDGILTIHRGLKKLHSQRP